MAEFRLSCGNCPRDDVHAVCSRCQLPLCDDCRTDFPARGIGQPCPVFCPDCLRRQLRLPLPPRLVRSIVRLLRLCPEETA